MPTCVWTIATDAVNADLQHAIVISRNRTYKSYHLQLCMQKLAIALEYLRVNNCSNVLLFRCNCTSAYKS